MVAWYRANPRRGAALGALALLLVTGGIALVLTRQPAVPTGHDDGSTPPVATPVETSAPPPSVMPSATVAPADWTALELPPYDPVAELVPSATDASGITTSGSFTLRSLTSMPAVELAAGLVVEPPVDLVVEPGPTALVATVRPASPLVENARYRIHLLAPDGALVGDWTFRTGGPLHAVRTLPDNETTQVPLDTGIEVEFDQDGVSDIAAHFSIDPAVDGEFEAHGRTWAFVPSGPLDPSTLYTVTVRAGLGIEGSSHVLESDVRFSFETSGPGGETADLRIRFDRPMHEARPNERSAIPVQVYGDTGEAIAGTREVIVYGLGTLAAARDAAVTLATDRDWAIRSSNGAVPTGGLVQAGSFEATVGLRWPNQYLELPTGFAAGWYLVEIPQDGRDAQLVLQVTDLATFVLVSESRTIAWVNDLARDAATAGASIRLPDGSTLGTTDAAGLLDAATPAVLLRTTGDGAPGPLVISTGDGRSIITMPAGPGPGFWFERGDASSKWWHLLGTDREQYRMTDTIRVWGLVRSRADRSVPSDLELRLFHGWSIDGPPIARQAVEGTSRGAIVGTVEIRDLPSGSYQVALFAGEEIVAQTGVQVTDIRKPTFQVQVDAGRRAYITGETVVARASASFFDGSSAPGLRLRVSASAVRGDDDREVTLDAAGEAELTYVATTSSPGPEGGSVNASPADPEEGASHGDASFVVFPSTVWIDAEAELADEVVTISGRLSRVDLAAVDEQMAAGWWGDPSGEAVAGGRVAIVVDRVTWRPVQVGTTYDFLLKKSVPLLRYEREVSRLATFDPTSAADGSFVQSLPFTGEGGVEITLRATDAQGRVIERALWAATPRASSSSAYPYLETPVGACTGAVSLAASIGEDVTLTMRSGEGTPSAEGRTLFIVGHLGIEDAQITTEAAFRRAFTDADLPSVTVRAVRMSPAGYLMTNDVVVRVDEADTSIDVTVEADRPGYAPGEDAAVRVTTTRSNGAPISADVVVQAIDLKLYAIAAANPISTTSLMAPVPAGFTDAYITHHVPAPPREDGCGATTGGGDPREDFQDTATFQLIRTGADGRGSATFPLPDDITSWVVSATAMGDGLESGTASIEVPVSLPFFVDAAIAPEYLVGEQPILQLRAFGDGLERGQPVRFTIAAPSLGLDPTVIEGTAFQPARAALPILTLGEHELTITGERVAGPELSDSVRRTLRVVPTRLRTTRTSTELVADRLQPRGGDGLTSYVVSDGGQGSLVSVLQELAAGTSARFDAALAAELARAMLVDDFNFDAASLPESGFDGRAIGHPSEGLAVLPYASADLALTARTALVAPERVPGTFLGEALRTAADDASASRERRILALAGLAGVGEDVLRELRAEVADGLTVRERVWLALGLLEAGDETGARSIERSILLEHGQRLDRWVRLDIGTTTPERMEATASVMLLAARLRDPVAADLSRYLLDNPTPEYLPALEQVGFARSAMAWLPRGDARFAWTVDGERHEETLASGATFTLTLTPDQQASLVVERLSGEILVTSTWAADARYDELPADPTITVRRSVSPTDHAPADALVRVTLDVTFDAEALEGCYQVTDLLPSGLSPVVATDSWGDPDVITPYEVEGQRVSWCVGTDRATARLGYAARVVSAGTYRWEPAIVQHAAAPSIGASTPVATYTID